MGVLHAYCRTWSHLMGIPTLPSSSLYHDTHPTPIRHPSDTHRTPCRAQACTSVLRFSWPMYRACSRMIMYYTHIWSYDHVLYLYMVIRPYHAVLQGQCIEPAVGVGCVSDGCQMVVRWASDGCQIGVSQVSDGSASTPMSAMSDNHEI